MRGLWVLVLVFAFVQNGQSQRKNIVVSKSLRPNEPSICINPKNKSELVGGSNLANVYRSNDGGLTWSDSVMTSSYGVWGDPVIICDTNEHFYFFHLSNPPFGSWIDRIVCQKSTDGGKTWSDGTFVGKDSTKAQDKEWAVVDKNTNTIYLTWTQFDKYGVRDSNMFSNILFSKSTDGGQTWQKAKQINEVSGDCIDSSNTTEGAVPAVGPNGEVYVSWAGPAGLVFDKSTDGGDTWLQNDVLIDSMKAGWTYDIPGINRCNGLPVTVCDLSNSPNRGTIYVNWSDQRNGTDNTDIFLSKSTDGGQTWSKAKRINDDTTKTHQFLTWMTVDETSGYLYFVWYDRRNYTDEETDVFMAVSYDGGDTFLNLKLSEKSFRPTDRVFFGDYTNISAVEGSVRPIWTSLDRGLTTIWTAIYEEPILGLENPDLPSELKVYPNPFNNKLSIDYSQKNAGEVSFQLFDITGEKHFATTRKVKQGEQKICIKTKKLNLKAGAYVYLLKTADKVYRGKVVYEP